MCGEIPNEDRLDDRNLNERKLHRETTPEVDALRVDNDSKFLPGISVDLQTLIV